MSQSALAPDIIIRDLTLRFGTHAIFERLNFTLPAGQFVSLLGASGSGKTSLLKVIAGLLLASSGSVEAGDGRPLAGRIAYMGQQDLLFPWLTVMENITLCSRLRGEKTDYDLAQSLLERVGLTGRGDDRPGMLSGGMRQRAAIARTLYARQPVVLMDEPFSALDTLTRTAIQTLAAELLLANHTVLLITHDPMEACRLSHRLLILSGQPGQIDDSYIPAGLPPRAPDDPDLLRSQAALLQQLLRGIP